MIEMEHKLKIKEISEEPILVRETNKYSSSLPRLSMDKEGRLVLFTNNMNKYFVWLFSPGLSTEVMKSFMAFSSILVMAWSVYGQLP